MCGLTFDRGIPLPRTRFHARIRTTRTNRPSKRHVRARFATGSECIGGAVKISTKRRQLLLMPFSVAALQASGLRAQGHYPDRPIKILVGFVPGGFTDVAARLVGQQLTE